MRRVGAVLARALATGLATVLCSGVLAGCTEEPAPRAEREARELSRQEYLDRADGICRRGADRADAVAARLEGRRPAAVRAGVRDEVVPVLREVGADVRGLNGPARLAARVEPVLDEVDRLLDFAAEDPSRLDDTLLFAGVQRDFRRLGLTACGELGP